MDVDAAKNAQEEPARRTSRKFRGKIPLSDKDSLIFQMIDDYFANFRGILEEYESSS